MKLAALITLMAACTSTDTQPCDTLAREVTQRHGTCTIAVTTALPCPIVNGAYCGDAANCPSGWSLSCDGSGSSCSYEGDACAGTGPYTFDWVQTLNGKDGLIVASETSAGECRFVECQ